MNPITSDNVCSNEYQVITNLVYLYPAYEAYRRGWWITALIYFLTGIVSSIHHFFEGQSFYWKTLDYLMASLYLCVSVIHWWKYIKFQSLIVLGTFVLSMICMVLDHQDEVCGICHILWHIVTGLGVGYMISLIPYPPSTSPKEAEMESEK